VVGLRLARQLLPSSGFTLGESQTLPFADGSFDVVLSTYALEHFVFAKESLEEMWRVCRPGGLLLLISPAYDDPRCLPPSVSHWSRLERARMILQQAVRQARRHIVPAHWDFACVSRPRILGDAYQSDFDAVHLVSAREISNFFNAKQGKILFERKRTPRPVREASPFLRMREHLRNLFLHLGIGEYAGLNLQIVVAKEATKPGSMPAGS
jgi:SAM-dependent methyltransferase